MLGHRFFCYLWFCVLELTQGQGSGLEITYYSSKANDLDLFFP